MNKAGLLLAVLCSLLSFSVLASKAGQPNIVILFADDMGYADLGSYGNPYIRTPNLDRIAQEGQRWTDFYVSDPVCSPSRGSLLTGKLSVNSGLYGRQLGVMFPGDSHGIPDQELTLAEALRSAGYRTGMFGKWHLGDAPDNYPTRHGFDVWYGAPYSNDMDRVGGISIERVFQLRAEGRAEEASGNFAENHKLFEDPKSKYWNIPLYRSMRTANGFDDTLVERPIDQPNFTRRLTEEAIRFIEAGSGEPFLLYLPYAMPHLPVFASEVFAGKSLRGSYGDAVEEIDWSAGQIIEVLKRLGIEDNTLLLFTSDNGPWQQVSITGAGSAGVLRDSKGSTWEGGVRVPGIFWWPGQIKPGVVSEMGTTMDVYATALTLAGVRLPEGIDGYDLASTLKTQADSPRNELPYYSQGDLQAYRKGPWKLHLRDGRTRELLDKPVLYNLHEDLAEQQDVADEFPEVVAGLLEAIEAHRAGLDVKEPIFDRRLQDFIQ